jgi:hypothetical protein
VNVAVIGSREYPNLKAVQEYVSVWPEGTIIVSGGARGVDQTAQAAAKQHGLAVVVHRPDYQRWPRKIAPLKRNRLVVDDAYFVVGFWDGRSHGTLRTIAYARLQGKPNFVIGPDGHVVDDEIVGDWCQQYGKDPLP